MRDKGIACIHVEGRVNDGLLGNKDGRIEPTGVNNNSQPMRFHWLCDVISDVILYRDVSLISTTHMIDNDRNSV